MELENQVVELNNRLYDLEKKEAGRKVGRLIKNLVTLLFVFGVIFASLKVYDYVKNELPNDIDKKVTEVQDEVIKKMGTH